MHSDRSALTIERRSLAVGVIDAADVDGEATLRLTIQIESAGAHLVAPFASDALIIITTTRVGLTAQVRKIAMLAHAAGVSHLVLAVVRSSADDLQPNAFDTLTRGFDTMMRRLNFVSAAIIPIDNASDKTAAISGAHILRRDQALANYLVTLPRPSPLHTSQLDPSPPSEHFAAHVACLTSREELLPGREYRLRIGSLEQPATITAIKHRLDTETLQRLPARTLSHGEIGVCTVATHPAIHLAPDSLGAARFEIWGEQTDEPIAAGTVDFALRRGQNVHWQELSVAKPLRSSMKAQRPCIVWFTGLSGAGKSTIANLVESALAANGSHTYLLDGDNVRHGLNKDLGFTAADRVENIRRVGEVARLFVDAGLIVLCSFISPFRAERAAVRGLLDDGEFIEIHVTAPLEVCEQRDPKGLYAKCRAGKLPNFTGIDSPYEAPENPDLILETAMAPADELAQRVIALLAARGMIAARD
ncbi:adenylyl-sulfate kinase [Hyphomicrobium sulfonivorans]|uniref:adenylyl-sulfate kinase n=1 Tax=Hyphomicrobium sulfonivorans TaxID=121290 RepID=UPI00156F5EF4|nr:adenylyl-sulfate kinase [Hyphomicrobium sulfonivorans]MBI1651257.1 adenylyl-sulfate kinase [Hyphomicrobium sulfonivorans]NSL73135.1 adenylyl-sulfate kinase [Hyphomicrobium sulfonivorans]